MKKILFLLSIAVIGLTACSREEDDIFGESADNRTEKAISEYTRILTGANGGWMMQYYPSSNLEFGGYTVTLYFDKSGEVTAYSDATDQYDVCTSLYQIKQSAGIVLSFDTHNAVFHQFSDPGAPLGGELGQGMSGDYDFNIIEATAERVILKGKKTGNYAVMTPIKGSWSDLYNNLLDVEIEMSRMVYIMTIDQDSIIVTRQSRTLNFTYQEDGEDIGISIPYIITTEGMEFIVPITIKGKTIEGFLYEEDAVAFTSNDPTVKLATDAPLSLQVQYSPWFITSDMSEAFAEAFQPTLEWSAENGERIAYMFFGEDIYGYGLNFWSNEYTGCINYQFKAINDTTVALTLSKKFGGDGEWYYDNANYDIIANALSGTYTITADDPSNPSSITLTNETGETLTLMGDFYADAPTYFPFESKEQE